MSLSHFNGIALSGVSAINGIAKSTLSAINGQTIGGGGGGGATFTALTNAASTSNVASFATASITPGTNALILCAVSNSKGSATADLPTLTGCGLTWVQVATVTWDSGLKRTTVFRAMGTPSAGAVTADFGGVNQTGCNIVVVQFAGTDTTGTNGSGAIVQSITNSGSGTTVGVTLAALTGSTNAVWMVGANRQTAGFGGTPKAGWTENTDTGYTSPGHGITDIYRLATTDNTPSSTSTSDNFAAIGVEIKVP